MWVGVGGGGWGAGSNENKTNSGSTWAWAWAEFGNQIAEEEDEAFGWNKGDWGV